MARAGLGAMAVAVAVCCMRLLSVYEFGIVLCVFGVYVFVSLGLLCVFGVYVYL